MGDDMPADHTAGADRETGDAERESSHSEGAIQHQLRKRLDRIEGAYEYFLGYAAQGTVKAAAVGADGEVRSRLESFRGAMDGLVDLFRDVGDREGLPFLEVLGRDVEATTAALELVLTREAISSQLIDNFNASVHVRALLTDLFLLDEALDLGAARLDPGTE